MDEYQHFVTQEDNDYENGQWINGEFYASGQRKGKTQTADERLYGVFAENSDEEYEGRKGKRRKKEQESFSKPVGFVSGGITGSSTDKADNIEKSERDIETEPQGNGREGLGGGLGFGGAGGNAGDGWIGGGFNTGGGLGNNQIDEEQEDQEQEPVGNLPTTFGKSIEQKASQRAKTKEAQERRLKEERRKSNKHMSTSQPSSMPGFNISSAAENMMRNMGFKGGGLGKHGQGIETNLEAQARAKNQGLGFSNFEHKMEQKPSKPAQEPLQVKQKTVSQNAWRKDQARKRDQREYKTAKEVLAEQSETRPAGLVSQPIVDMRGPHARVITDMEEIGAQNFASVEDDVPMPELQHNLRVMVDLAANEIQVLDGKLRDTKDKTVLLSKEAERLKSERVSAKDQVSQLKNVLEQVNQAQQGASRLSLQQLHQIYSDLKERFPAEYVMYRLPDIALTQVLPRIFAVMANSSPLTNPSQGFPEISSWRPLLESPEQANAVYTDMSTRQMDPFSTLLSMTVIPGLARAITNSWEPRDPEPMLLWMDTWRDALPTDIQIIVLDTLVFPKVSRAVEAWDPRQEPIPVHAWLHPWLPWLGPRLESLYPTIRFRLTSALQAWHPSDGSALALLMPWHKVFAERDWDNMMTQSIVPRLEIALTSEFVINPGDQKMTAYYWVTSWAAVINTLRLVRLFEEYFFPQWRTALHAWLTSSPNYTEIQNWYVNWKEQMPIEIRNHERILAQFSTAMDMMYAAMENRPIPMYDVPPPMDAYPQAANVAIPQSYGRWGGGTVAQPDIEPSLAEMVEMYANENNIAFTLKNRHYEGFQVYGFGLVSIILDNTKKMIRAQKEGGIWDPLTLEGLLVENQKRQRKK